MSTPKIQSVFIRGMESSLWSQMRAYAKENGHTLRWVVEAAIREFLMRRKAKEVVK